MRFGVRVIRLCQTLGDLGAAGVINRQLIRSGTSVGAQYREACRARSSAEFVSKVQSALQELDESMYWMELLIEAEIVERGKLKPLLMEADELAAIFVASVRTSRSRSASKKAD